MSGMQTRQLGLSKAPETIPRSTVRVKCSASLPLCQNYSRHHHHIWSTDTILIRQSPFFCSLGANLGHLENVTFCRGFSDAEPVTLPTNRMLWCPVHKPMTAAWEADGPVCLLQTFSDP